MSDVASTNTLSPSISNTLSIMPAPDSKAIECWKPEQPPPWTERRNPAGTGFCEDIISLTFEIAFELRVTGAVLGFTAGTVVVAILNISFGTLIIPKLWKLSQ